MKTAKPVLSRFQVTNLRKLAKHLRQIRQRTFDMSLYATRRGSFVHAPSKCGTVCCAVGHGPKAGVDSSESDSHWSTYSHRVFIPRRARNAWAWCFSAFWSEVDNTPQGAADRITYLLKHGVPSNWEKQMWGHAPLCYRKDAA